MNCSIHAAKYALWVWADDLSREQLIEKHLAIEEMPAQGHDEARIIGYLELELPQHSSRTL